MRARRSKGNSYLAMIDPPTSKYRHGGYVQVAWQRLEVRASDQQLLQAWYSLQVKRDRHRGLVRSLTKAIGSHVYEDWRCARIR